jgi:hypothetical protein
MDRHDAVELSQPVQGEVFSSMGRVCYKFKVRGNNDHKKAAFVRANPVPEVRQRRGLV